MATKKPLYFRYRLPELLAGKSHIEKRIITQTELAEKTGIVQPLVSNHFNGVFRQINANTIQAYADYFGVKTYEVYEIVNPDNNDETVFVVGSTVVYNRNGGVSEGIIRYHNDIGEYEYYIVETNGNWERVDCQSIIEVKS